MSYQVHDESSCTLTSDERAAEAKRILTRIRSAIDEAMAGERWVSTQTSLEFARRKLTELDLWGRVDVSVKELFWLRDLGERVE